MNRMRTDVFVVVVCFLTIAAGASSAQELYRNQMSSGAGWSVNASTADNSATFGYDYSADGIPEAPNSRIGDAATTGVKMESNLVNGVGTAFTLYPTAGAFVGDYQLRFDAWMNYDADERINGSSAGTAEFIGGGIGYDNAMTDIGVGAQLLFTGDGGSGSDWRVFADGAFLDSAEMAGGSRNGFDPYYSNFLPGVSPPGAQAQVSFPPGTAGSPGFQWVTVEINSLGDVANVYIENPGGARLHIARFNHDGTRPYTTTGNIGLIYVDYFSSVTSRPDLTFGIIDNVEVWGNPVPVALLSFSVD